MSDIEVVLLGRPQERPNQIEHSALQRLETIRKKMGLSREQFAVKYVGVSYITYHRWCKGAFKQTSIARLEELEELAGKLEEELKGEEDAGSTANR